MQFSRFIAFRLSASQQKSFTRTIIRIATAAVALSICVMVVTTALVRGFKKEISVKVYAFWGHINIMDIRADNSYEALPVIYDPDLVASLADIASVEVDYGMLDRGTTKSKGGVTHVQTVAHIPAIITTVESMDGLVIKGAGDDFDWSAMSAFLIEGSLPDPNADDNQILISEYTSKRLRLSSGDKVVLHVVRNSRQLQRRFTIAGLFRTGLEDYDKKFAVAPIASVRSMLGWEGDQIGAYEVFVENVDDAEVISDYIYLEELPNELYSQTIRSRFPNIFEWLELQDVNQIVILGLTLVVSVINMISVLLILILERVRMIGVLKALGASTRKIQGIFLYHAMVIIGRGMLIGNTLGLGLCLIQQKFRIITLNEEDYYLSYAPVDVSLVTVLWVNALALGVIMLFMTLPSLLVARIDPVKTIQFN